MFRALLTICLFLLGTVLGAWTSEGNWFETPKSSRIANYRIQATLDWESKTLEGLETISWRNTGSVATQELPLHLYLNAFKGPQSLFSRESGGRSPSDDRAWGYCRLKQVSVDGQVANGHSGEDETVYWVRLPSPVAPGETLELEVQWEVRFPRVSARSGWGGESLRDSRFLMGGQWFPKVGVYQNDHWNCHAYHANTEFFADFGVYDVALSLPKGLLLAHTGTMTNFKAPGGVPKDPEHPQNVIWKLHAEDVHDFAWAVAPSFTWDYKTYEYRGVQVFHFYQPENRANLERQRAAVQAALRNSADWYFPYPYPVLTIVDVPKDSPGADGMEYPTLFTASSTSFDPWQLRMSVGSLFGADKQDGGPEQTTIHEFGHQYFQGMLASDEVEEPWLDEGITSWFTQKTLDRTYQALFGSRRFQIGTDTLETADYWQNPSLDPMIRAGFRMFDSASYSRSAYSKPVLVLNQLEAMLGRPLTEQILSTYTREMAFKHPTGQDFKRIAERVSGRDLTAFWRDFVEGTDVLDVVIQGVDAPEVLEGGWMDSGKGLIFVRPQSAAPGHRGTLTLVRRGGLCLPMTLWVRLENRTERRVYWGGQDRWTTFEFESPVVTALLDPDGNYPMLKDRLHASYSIKPLRRGFYYWSQLVMGTLTSALQGAGLG